MSALAITELHKLPGYKTAPRIWRGGVRVLDPKWVEEASSLYRLFGASIPKSEAEALARATILQDNHIPDVGAAPGKTRDQIFGEIELLHTKRILTNGILLVKMAQAYGLSANDLRGADRHRPIVLARHHAMFEMRRFFPLMSLPQIGHRFGDRDHTTVLHAIRTWPAKAAKLGIPVPGFDPLPRRQA